MPKDTQETVVAVSAANADVQQSNVQNEFIEENQQSQEIHPINHQCNIEKITNKSQNDTDDEQSLMTNKVYQHTTEAVRVIDHRCSSKWLSSMNCRQILWYVAFVGFMVNYMYRININIAIVEMVSIKKPTISSDHSSECIAHPNATIQSPVNMTSVELDSIDQKTAFAWNESEQNRVLGAFFWLHWTTQIFGGIFAARYGTKLIFGLSNFISSFLCLFIPTAANWNINYLIALRIIQGAIAGLSWPAMHHLSAQWIPPNELGQFLTSYMGSAVGIVVFYPLFGFIMSIWSWQSIFYISGIFGALWYAAWVYFVYDSPNIHPRIDPVEREYIQSCLGDSVHAGKIKTPWFRIIFSWAVWVNLIGQFGAIWGLFTMMTQAPTYFYTIHGWGIKKIGLLTGISHLTRIIFAMIFSAFTDHLLKSETLTRNNVRKLAGGVSNIVHGVFVLALAYSGCNSTAAIIWLIIATTMHGAISAGLFASVIDISPNFSGVILGFNGLFGCWPGFISPYIVGKLTNGNQTVQQWQYVFLISAAMLILTGFIYVCTADSTLASWNQPKTALKSAKDEEMKVLKKSPDNNSELMSAKNG